MVIARSTTYLRRAVVAAVVWCVLPLALPTVHAQSRRCRRPPSRADAAGACGPGVQISMEQAVSMALETNLGLKSNKLNLGIASQNIASARPRSARS
jgi:hypothetical protein